jgi:hypothetical protein
MPIMAIPNSLYYPQDIDEAWEAYGASCGPCSLAAIASYRVMEVQPYLADYAARGYMNPTHMQDALSALPGIHRWWNVKGLPAYGLAFIQWGGHEQRPVKVQYRYTHWIACHGDMIFEVNAPSLVTWTEWQRIMPRLIQQEGKGNGTFSIRRGFEVRLG